MALIDLILAGFTRFYRVLLGFIDLKVFTGLYQVLPGFVGFYRLEEGFYRVLTRFLPGFVGFYRLEEGFTGI